MRPSRWVRMSLKLRRDLMTAKRCLRREDGADSGGVGRALGGLGTLRCDVGDETAKARARDAMVALLNKLKLGLRNLVRDVNEALE